MCTFKDLLNQQTMKESNQSNGTNKPETQRPAKLPETSFSNDTDLINGNKTFPASLSVASLAVSSASIEKIKLSPRDTPNRKYFDSGDYELAKAGVLSSASVGSLHPNPEKMLAYSKSFSQHQIQPFIISQRASREDLELVVKNQAAPNTNLHKSTFSFDDLVE
jgi:hypothetical protein